MANTGHATVTPTTWRKNTLIRVRIKLLANRVAKKGDNMQQQQNNQIAMPQPDAAFEEQNLVSYHVGLE